MAIYPKKRNGKVIRNSYRVVQWSHGRSHEKTFHGTRKEAEAFEARWVLELEAAGPVDSRTAPPFSQFSNGRYRTYAEAHLAKGTWRNRIYQIATLIEHFGDTPLTQINAEAVERFQNERLKDVGPVKVNDDVKVLSAILSYARSQSIPAADPKIRRLPERKRQGRVMVWDAEQVQTLYKAFRKHSPRLLPITVCLLNTGMRKGEALALRWESVDLDKGMLKIHPSEEWQPKNNKPREIPIGSALRPWLEGLRKSEWVFPSSTGRRYATWPQKQWDRAREAAGVGGSPHVCRHTYASHFLQSRPNLFLLAQVLGHSHTKVTELYSHLLPDYLESARDAVCLPVGLAPTQNHGSDHGQTRTAPRQKRPKGR